METRKIRNFCIIAHIDHGKSTLADRFIQRARLVSDRDFHDQILDNMDIERERGITIKSQAVAIPYKARDGQDYMLNLVDTPGHVDFSYEVSRAISACEGAVLLIDASQGVEAQTLANMYMALEHNLEIIPVINKIDLPSADIEGVKKQIDHDLGLDPSPTPCSSRASSARAWTSCARPSCSACRRRRATRVRPLKALIFDSHYDVYRGVIVHVRMYDGTLRAGQTIRFHWNGSAYKVEETGVFRLGLVPVASLGPGEVGYLIAGIKTVADTRVGDTVTDNDRPCAEPLAGFREVKPVVFSSIYPVDANDYEELVQAMAKLKLNDASLIYEKDSSVALGYGFRCGFLGLLHLEIVQERLEREFEMSIVFTAPSVQYQLTLQGGKEIRRRQPGHLPGPVADPARRRSPTSPPP